MSALCRVSSNSTFIFRKIQFFSIFMLLDSFEDLRQIQSLKKLPGVFFFNDDHHPRLSHFREMIVHIIESLVDFLS